jgi:hypothetical protein
VDSIPKKLTSDQDKFSITYESYKEGILGFSSLHHQIFGREKWDGMEWKEENKLFMKPCISRREQAEKA